jgi:hypothetical protein
VSSFDLLSHDKLTCEIKKKKKKPLKKISNPNFLPPLKRTQIKTNLFLLDKTPKAKLELNPGSPMPVPIELATSQITTTHKTTTMNHNHCDEKEVWITRDKVF